jgi:ubiquitin C-terminal hydrolase
MKGLANHGNTCYFNTALQCLLHIPTLTNHFIEEPYEGDCAFTTTYSSVVRVYWTKSEQEVDVGTLIKHFREEFPRFKRREQHDVQETVLCIIDILERARPEIKQWFYGKKIQETIWPGGKSSNEEDFSIHLITSSGKDMGEMLSKSTEWNTLENFEDTGGKVHHVATTRMLFSKLSKVLMISFDTKSHVQIIESIIIDKHEYNLIASAVHVGNQNDGHYVSFVKRKNTWFLIDDESVREHPLPQEAGFYFMVYNLKTPSSEYSP